MSKKKTQIWKERNMKHVDVTTRMNKGCQTEVKCDKQGRFHDRRKMTYTWRQKGKWNLKEKFGIKNIIYTVSHLNRNIIPMYEINIWVYYVEFYQNK